MSGPLRILFTNITLASRTGTEVYLKLILRAECVVISFHEDEGEDDEGQ